MRPEGLEQAGAHREQPPGSSNNRQQGASPDPNRQKRDFDPLADGHRLTTSSISLAYCFSVICQ